MHVCRDAAREAVGATEPPVCGDFEELMLVGSCKLLAKDTKYQMKNEFGGFAAVAEWSSKEQMQADMTYDKK